MESYQVFDFKMNNGFYQHIIEKIEEAQGFATQWLWTYNNERPNMAIGGNTPAMKLKMAA
jgi:putative transposase